MFRRKGNTIINARWAMCKAVQGSGKATCKGYVQGYVHVKAMCTVHARNIFSN